MINILKMLILKLFYMLPDSPLHEYYSTLDMTDYQYINWMLPLDICSNIMLGWLACVALYYVYLSVKKIVNILISGVAKAAYVAKFLV